MARENGDVTTSQQRTSSAHSRDGNGPLRPLSRPGSRTGTTSRPGSTSAYRNSRTPGSRPGSSALRGNGSRPGSSKLGPVRPPSSRLSMRASRQPSARLKRQISSISSVSFYDRAKIVLGKPSADRSTEELNLLENWLRKKSKLFEKLNRDVLLDVLKHCEIQSALKDCLVIQQGAVGSSFYIILRGRVSILVKDEFDDIDDDDDDDDSAHAQHKIRSMLAASESRIETDRSKLGHFVGHLSDGRTFGELALIDNNCVRSASIICDEPSDFIVISRELYNRSVAKLVSQEYEEKLAFVNNCKLFSDWANKWKRNIAISIVRQKLSYDEVLVRQGENADNLYFVLQGELKLVADPEMHKQQFADFINKSTGILQEESTPVFPQGLVNYLSPKSRQGVRLKSAAHQQLLDRGTAAAENKAKTEESNVHLSPSLLRKKTAKYRAKLRKYNICYLEKGQMLGDVEFLTGLTKYHATAVSTQSQTVVMRLHRVQFNRFFKKKNPDTVTAMTRTLGLQIPRRLGKEIHQNVPLIKYIILRLDDLNGTETMPRKLKDDFEKSLPHVDSHYHHDSTSLPARLQRAKSGVSSRSYPHSSRSFPVTGKVSLHESLPRNVRSLNLPMVPSMANYLNTQVQHIIGSEQPAEQRPMATTSEAGAMGTEAYSGGGIMDNFSNYQRVTQTAAESRTKQPARTGIFFKLMQVTQPNVDRDELAIESEEFNYLCQVRRRIARQLNEYYPFASLESFLKFDNDQMPQTKKRRSTAKSASQRKNGMLSKSLPNIKGATQKDMAMKDMGSQESLDEDIPFNNRRGQQRTRVAFSVPAD